MGMSLGNIRNVSLSGTIMYMCLKNTVMLALFNIIYMKYVKTETTTQYYRSNSSMYYA